MSAKLRYEEMFQTPLFKSSKNIANEAQENISWARKTLRKNDRITWFLKMAKYMILTSNEKQLSESEKKWVVKMGWEQFNHPRDNEPLHYTKRQLDDLKISLLHYLDLDLHPINTMVFSGSEKDLLEKMKNIESEWLSTTNSRSVHEYGTRFLVVPVPTHGNYKNELVWFNLEKSGCPIEGDAMGHCGNGKGKESETVFSLRSRDPEHPNRWIPRATFILHDDGNDGYVIGEMKGYGNQKPSVIYHEAIIALLKNDSITGINGGGWLPENNFSISDLNEIQKRDLYELKPVLMSANDLWLMNNQEMNKTILNKIKIELGASPFLYGGDKISIQLGGAAQIAINFEMKNLCQYASYIDSEEYKRKGISVSELENEFIGLIDELNTSNIQSDKDLINSLKNYLVNNHGAYIEDYDLEITKGEDIFYLYMNTSDQNLNEMMSDVCYVGYEVGTHSNIKQSFDTLIKNMEQETGGSIIRDSELGVYDLFFSPQEFMELHQRYTSKGFGDNSSISTTISNFKCSNENGLSAFFKSDLEGSEHGFHSFDNYTATNTMYYYISENMPEYMIETKHASINLESFPFDNVTTVAAKDNFVNKKLNDLLMPF